MAEDTLTLFYDKSVNRGCKMQNGSRTFLFYVCRILLKSCDERIASRRCMEREIIMDQWKLCGDWFLFMKHDGMKENSIQNRGL